MIGIHFDIVTQEITFKNNDFELTENPSVQNGGIIEISRCAFIETPMLGIGLTDFINSNSSTASFEMNRWQFQCKNDGATKATWKGTVMSGNGIQVTTDISYL